MAVADDVETLHHASVAMQESGIFSSRCAYSDIEAPLEVFYHSYHGVDHIFHHLFYHHVCHFVYHASYLDWLSADSEVVDPGEVYL